MLLSVLASSNTLRFALLTAIWFTEKPADG
jgi:hypothetical protein